jgi:hypothetical protein
MTASRSSPRSETSASLAQVLHASGSDQDRAAKLALYAWIVGRWDMEVTTFKEDGTTHEGRGEIHAGWVLQGRAIQDVWMIPRLKERKPGVTPLPGSGNWYGTTLRIYDPNLDAWPRNSTTPRRWMILNARYMSGLAGEVEA